VRPGSCRHTPADEVGTDRGSRTGEEDHTGGCGSTRVGTARTPAEGPGPAYGDVVGDLIGWHDGVLTITRRDGSVAHVPEATIVAGKVVPPPVRRLTRPCSRTSWPFVAADGRGRAGRLDAARRRRFHPQGELGARTRGPRNSLRRGTRSSEHVVRRACASTLLQVVVGDPWDRFLADAGWPAEAETLVRTGRLVRAVDALRDVDAADVEVAERVDDACWAGTAGPRARWARPLGTSSRGLRERRSRRCPTPSGGRRSRSAGSRCEAGTRGSRRWRSTRRVDDAVSRGPSCGR